MVRISYGSDRNNSSMALNEILREVPSHDDDNSAKLRQDLDMLRMRINTNPANVSQGEIVQGIRMSFIIESCSDYLEQAGWLMQALKFTTDQIDISQIQTAWDKFQSEHSDVVPFDRNEWPELEGIAAWYFDHREDPNCDEQAMVARS